MLLKTCKKYLQHILHGKTGHNSRRIKQKNLVSPHVLNRINIEVITFYSDGFPEHLGSVLLWDYVYIFRTFDLEHKSKDLAIKTLKKYS